MYELVPSLSLWKPRPLSLLVSLDVLCLGYLSGLTPPCLFLYNRAVAFTTGAHDSGNSKHVFEVGHKVQHIPNSVAVDK